MTALLVRGGKPLIGRIEPSANKNAVLPVLCATLLSDGPIVLRNVPEITDVLRIVDFFGELETAIRNGPARVGRRGLSAVVRSARPAAVYT